MGKGVNDAVGKIKEFSSQLRNAANHIPLITVETREELGEWLGHCKYDKEGAPRKVKGCSSIAIKNFGEDTEALSFVRNYIKDNKLGE